MKCPNCYSEIAPAPRCPRCEWPLQPGAESARPDLYQPAQDDQWGAPPGQGAWADTPGSGAPAQRWGGPDAAWSETIGQGPPAAPAWDAPSPPSPTLGDQPVAPGGFPPAPQPPLRAAPLGMPSGTGSVPLDSSQKSQLFLQVVSGVLPFLFVGGFFFFMDASFARNPIFALIFTVVLLLAGYGALQALRDLRSGVALVRPVRLTRSWRSGGKSVSYYGEFEGIGNLKLRYALYNQLRPGMLYQVTYSPASKIAWSAEPLS